MTDTHHSTPDPHPNSGDDALIEMRGQLWSIVDLRGEIDRFETMLRAAGKARATIATYVVQSERFLNWLEGNYSPRSRHLSKPYGYRVSDETRSKYDPLRAYLQKRPDNAVRLTFRNVEDVIGSRLPASARKYAFWWANDTTGNHSQAAAWMRAGRRVAQLDLINYTVMFIRADRTYGAPTVKRLFG